MPLDGLCERFPGITVRKMERLPPSPLVEKSGKIIIRVDERLVLGVALLNVGRMKSVVLVNASLHVVIASKTCFLSKSNQNWNQN